MTDTWDRILQAFAGAGTRKHNLEKCRKELAASCANYEQRVKHTPPTTEAASRIETRTPSGASLKTAQTTIGLPGTKSLTQWAYNPHRSKPLSLEYREDKILERSQILRDKAQAENTKRGKVPETAESAFEPLESYTANDFSTDFVSEDAEIKKTAAKTLAACGVRNTPSKYSHGPEELHNIRTRAWEKHLNPSQHVDAPSPARSTPESDNGVTLTEDGCIIQHGFNITPPSPVRNAEIVVTPHTNSCHRALTVTKDILDGDRSLTKDTPVRGKPLTNDTRTLKSTSQFRKREIPRPRKDSTLSGMILSASANGPETKLGDNRHPFVSQQHAQAPVTRPNNSIFFSESASSSAVVFDNDDDDDDSPVVSGSWMDISEDGDENNNTEPLPTSKLATSPRMGPVQQVTAEPTPPQSVPIPTASLSMANRSKQRIDTPCPAPLGQNRVRMLQAMVTDPTPEASPPKARLNAVRPTPKQPAGPLKNRQPTQALVAPRLAPTPDFGKLSKIKVKPRASEPKIVIPPHLAMYQRYVLCLTSDPTPIPIDENAKNYTVPALLRKATSKQQRTPAWRWDHIAPIYGYSVCEAFYVIAI